MLGSLTMLSAARPGVRLGNVIPNDDGQQLRSRRPAWWVKGLAALDRALRRSAERGAA